jgi:hypothetical protein
MNEPSVLDFVKAKLMPWKYKIEELDMEEISNSSDTLEVNEIGRSVDIEKFEKENFLIIWKKKFSDWPWYFLLSIIFAILGQILLEPPNQKKSACSDFLFV